MRIQVFCATLMAAVGSPAFADDFCVSLKAAVAAAQTDFSAIEGREHEFIPSWRDATIKLPYVDDCHVDPDKRNLSYYCSWEREQPAAVNARYKYAVKEVDQCLTDFEKTVGDQVTTWRNPASGTVTVNARHVMKNTQTWSVSLTVRR